MTSGSTALMAESVVSSPVISIISSSALSAEISSESSNSNKGVSSIPHCLFPKIATKSSLNITSDYNSFSAKAVNLS